MGRVLTIGELLLRLTPPNYQQLSETKDLQLYYGGAEVNVAVGLSHLGHQVSFLTSLPDHSFGDGAIRHLQSHGVETSLIYRRGERVGIYYVEEGYSLKPTRVVYDRKNSSVLELSLITINWDNVYQETDWLHMSGITPALDPEMIAFTKLAMKEAKARGVNVSLDFNFRSKLWSKEDAKEAIISLLPYVDHCFAGWKDFALLFEWPLIGKTYTEQLKNYYDILRETYDVRSGSCTNREIIGSNSHRLTGYYYNENSLHEGEPMTFEVLDRIGGGDSYAAGILHGIISKNSVEKNVQFATNFSVMNHFVKGDHDSLSTKDVEEFIQKQNQDVHR